MNGGTLKQTVLASFKEGVESNREETRKSKFEIGIFIAYTCMILEPVNHQQYFSTLEKFVIPDEAVGEGSWVLSG